MRAVAASAAVLWFLEDRRGCFGTSSTLLLLADLTQQPGLLFSSEGLYSFCRTTHTNYIMHECIHFQLSA